jgi:ParB-like chromosome segregation protein Spo0J
VSAPRGGVAAKPAKQHTIAYMDPARLTISKRNARTHSAKQLAQIEHSIQAFGFNNPILIDERREIIAGAGRRTGAMNLKLPLVPTITLTGLSSTQKRALALADNRIALNGNWDAEILSLELKDLQKSGDKMDLELLGFSKQDLVSLLGAKDESVNIEYKESFGVVVECENERAQVKLLKQLTGEGYKVKALIA